MLGGTERERDSLIQIVNTLPKEIETIDWKVTGIGTLAGFILGVVLTVIATIQLQK